MAALLTMELDHEELMFNALRDLLPSLGRFTNKQLGSKYGKEATEIALSQLIDYVILACGSELSRNEVSALYVQVLRCLVNYIKGQLKVPVTLNTVLSNMHLLEFSVSLSFPGYYEAGFLKALIRPKQISDLAKAS